MKCEYYENEEFHKLFPFETLSNLLNFLYFLMSGGSKTRMQYKAMKGSGFLLGWGATSCKLLRIALHVVGGAPFGTGIGPKFQSGQ